jgi:adenylate cyclase class 2
LYSLHCGGRGVNRSSCPFVIYCRRMAQPKEVEIKFRVDNVQKLKRELRAAGFRQLTPRTHEMNTLYDLPGLPLRKRGELLRIRKYGRRWILTHKAKRAAASPAGSSERHKIRIETETDIANGDKLAAIFGALGFFPVFRYEKFRSEWTDNRGHVVIDETPIGNLAEIEGSPRWIDRTAKTFGVTRDSYIVSTYAEMFFDWKKSTGSPAQEMTFKAVAGGKRKALPRRARSSR